MRQHSKWDAVIRPILQDTDIELVGIVKTGDSNNTTLRVYVDKSGGITIDDIAKVSREIDMVLSVEMGEHPYVLEVSSPGLDRMLFTPAHFQQQISKKVKIKLGMPQNNRKNFMGILQAATDDEVTVMVDLETFVFPYSEIDEARLVSEINFGKATSERG